LCARCVSSWSSLAVAASPIPDTADEIKSAQVTSIASKVAAHAQPELTREERALDVLGRAPGAARRLRRRGGRGGDGVVEGQAAEKVEGGRDAPRCHTFAREGDGEHASRRLAVPAGQRAAGEGQARARGDVELGGDGDAVTDARREGVEKEAADVFV